MIAHATTAQCCTPGAPPVTDTRASELAHVFKALGDPARVKLFFLLSSSSTGEMCVCDLVEPLGLSQPTVSHHMKILVEAGLATREQRGRWAYFGAVAHPLLTAVEHLANRAPERMNHEPIEEPPR